MSDHSTIALAVKLAIAKAKLGFLKASFGSVNRFPAGSSKGGQFAPKGGTGVTAPQLGLPGGSTWKESGWAGSGMWSKPKAPPPGAKPHPAKDDKGNAVSIDYPTPASPSDTWGNAKAVATFTPGGKTPEVLNGVAMKPWSPPKEGWAAVGGTNEKLDADFPFEPHATKKTGAGVIILEPDGRVWLTKPTNEFGGYKHTLPKGTAESGLTMQQNAIKEAFEETGLKVKIVGIAADIERDTSKARYYFARRVGGTPRDMGWESQALRLAPRRQALDLLNKPHDKTLLADALDEMGIRKAAGQRSKAESTGKPGHWQFQERWPGGSALGGQWKAMGADGITAPPKIAGGLEGFDTIYQKTANAVHDAAQSGDVSAANSAVLQYVDATIKFKAGDKSSYVKWGAQVAQYAAQVKADFEAKIKATATADKISGPQKLSAMTAIGGKPGGSNPGGMYQDAEGKWLVKGSNAGDATPRSQNEVLASKIMAAVGVGAPEMKLVDLEGKHGGGIGVASKWIDGAAALNPMNAAHVAAAQADFAVHAWLANYDALGLGMDNTMIVGGKAVNIDPGGALLYRAQGQPKGDKFTNKADEFDSMRNPWINPNGAKIYGSMTASQLAASAEKLKLIDDATIGKLVQTYGPGSDYDKGVLTAKLIARKADLLARVAALSPPAAPASKPAPAPTPAATAAQSSPMTVKAEKLTFVSGGSDKFWQVAVVGTKVVTQWGKNGTEGKQTFKEMGKVSAAVKEAEKLYQSKKAKGYVDAGFADMKVIAPGAAPAPARAASTPKPEPLAPVSAIAKPTAWPNGGTAAWYNGLTDKAQALHAKGDLAGLEAMKFKPNGDPVWSATANGKLMGQYHAALVADLQAKQAAQTMATVAAAQAVVAQPAPVIPKAGTTAPGGAAAMPDFAKYKLDESNTNAKSHNPKIDLIADLAQKGDIKGILSLGYGIGGYSKKQAGVANDALKALGSEHFVVPGQKPNTHPALTGGIAPAAVAAAAKATNTPPPQPHPATQQKPAERSGWLKLNPGDKIIEQGESFGVKWAQIETPAKGYDPQAIPKPPDFFLVGTQGPNGTSVSSKKEVNDANNAAVSLIFSTATTNGTPAALKALQFDVIDKNTGQPTGAKIGIAQHPASKVKAYYTDVLAEMEAQLKPGLKTVQSGSFTGGYSDAAAKLALDHPKIAYEDFKAHAQKAADYIVLSSDGASSLPVPKNGFQEFKPGQKLHDEFQAASNAKFATLSAAQQKAAKAYTGSSYGPWNDALRSGDVDSSSFKAAQPLVKAFEKAAVDLPEGSIIWRGIDVGQATYESVVGGVIQDGSFNSGSYGSFPGFSGKPTWLRIHVAKGVKAVHATSFSHFGTGEREIIIQNGVRYAVLKVEHHKSIDIPDILNNGKVQTFKNKTIVDVIALPHDSP